MDAELLLAYMIDHSRLTKLATSSFKFQPKFQLCQKCKRIDFGAIYQFGYRSYDPMYEQFDISNDTECSLCLFFLFALEGPRGYTLISQGPEKLAVTLQQDLVPLTFSDALGSSQLQYFMTLHGRSARTSNTTSVTLSFNDRQTIGQPNTARALQPDRINFDPINNWIRRCRQQHEQKCKLLPQELQRLPRTLQVIDCNKSKIIEAPAQCRYVALSYVWGPSMIPDLILDTTAVEDLPKPLPRQLPRTIKDAITVVLQLGFRYLWVDKYCIDQFNPDEMHRQLKTMDQIYRVAELTIVAAAGESAEHGLPGMNGLCRISQPNISIQGRRLTSGLRNPGAIIQDTPWYTRAWTYQEGLFSRRRLIFTNEQVFYECDTAAYRESVEDGLAYPTSIGASSDFDWSSGLFRGGFTSRHHSFATHVSQYTMRTLSHQSDALNAMCGVFRAFSALPVPIYQFYGIPAAFEAFMPDKSWAMGMESQALIVKQYGPDIYSLHAEHEATSAFSFGLLWDLIGVPYARRRYGFPSWSWAGWIAPVAWPGWNQHGVLYKHQKVVIHVNHNNAMRTLTAQMLDEINNNATEKLAVAPTMHIDIYAEVIPFKMHYRYVDDPDLKPGFYVEHRINRSGSEQSVRVALWPLSLTIHTEIGEEPYSRIQPPHDILECLILCGSFGLVVWGEDELKTRIGVIPLRGWDYKARRVGRKDWYLRDESALQSRWLPDRFEKTCRTVRLA